MTDGFKTVPDTVTHPAAIACFVAASVLGAGGQFLYKAGAERATAWQSDLLNWRILAGMACYIAVMALFVAAFKFGGKLTVLYPIYALTFMWAAFIAWGAYGEPVRPIHAAGFVLLIAGMYLMGR